MCSKVATSEIKRTDEARMITLEAAKDAVPGAGYATMCQCKKSSS
jgi:hypothetical protein